MFTSEMSNDMGLKLAGDVGSLPALGKVTTYAFNISGGKVTWVAASWNVLSMWALVGS